jgi:hypothetical protein
MGEDRQRFAPRAGDGVTPNKEVSAWKTLHRAKDSTGLALPLTREEADGSSGALEPNPAFPSHRRKFEHDSRKFVRR